MAPPPLSVPPPSAPPAGFRIGHFRVMRRIGRGGMGEVLLARDTRLGRKVALKLVHSREFDSPERMERFMDEARITARFNHPHIVTIYEVGEHQGRPYLALEYIEGEDLAARMSDRRMSVREATRIGMAIAEALTEAHRHGVLHRDLKPGNVLIGRDGRVRVVDFGLAKHVAHEPESQRDVSVSLEVPVEISQAVGTPKFMAPEQWREEPSTSATDMWAFGVVLYAMLTHRLPFEEGNLADQAFKVCTAEPTPLESIVSVPQELAALVERCMKKTPSERPSASDALAILSQLVGPRERRRGDEESPFRGLRPFTERHAHLFYGRDSELEAFVEQLRTTPAMVVLGPSGAGKSSFVHAGVIPRLREQESWLVLHVRPGSRPLMALAARLVRGDATTSSSRLRTQMSAVTRSDRAEDSMPGTSLDGIVAETQTTQLAIAVTENPRLLGFELRALAEERGVRVVLFVDQLEEVHTLCRDREEANAFLRAVRWATDDPIDPVRVIVTLRDDYLGRLATGPEMRELLSQVTVLQRPDGAQLREILRQPLQQVGYRYEDDRLVDEMVEAVGGEPACLPILQFALSRLWEQRDRSARVLLRSAYEEMGGVEGALARHADGVLASLDSPVAARALLLRMVTSEGTRRMVSRKSALDGLDDDAKTVLARLTEARLVTVAKVVTGDGMQAMIELAHESLVSSWGTLRRWIDESREDLAFLQEVGQAAALWDRRGRRDEELWRGEALHEATRALTRMKTEVPAPVRTFVDEAAARERRAQRRRRAGYAGVVLLLAAAAVAATVAALFVRKERDRAELERAEALREGAHAALAQGRMLEARAKLRDALERQGSTAARGLWWHLREEPLLWREYVGGAAYAIAVSPEVVAAASQDGPIYLFDAVTAEVRLLRGHRDQVVGVAMTPDGRRIATSSLDGTIRIWDVTRGTLERVLEADKSGMHGVAFGDGGKLLAAGGYDHTVRVWNLEGDKPPRVLRGHEAAVRGVAFSPDARLVASAGTDRVVRVWDLATGKTRFELRGHERETYGVAFSPDGRILAASGYDGTLRLWTVANGKPLRTMRHGTGISHIAFTPDGKRIATAGADRTARIWEVASGAEVERYMHDAQVTGVAFASDGRTLATSTTGREVSLYAVDRKPPRRYAEGHGAYVNGVAFSPDGKTLASGGHDKRILLWNVASGDIVGALEGHQEGVGEVAYTPDGRTLVSVSKDATVRLWDAKSGAPGLVLSGHRAEIYEVDLSPDGELVATGSYDQTARIWRLRDGAQLHVLEGHTDRVRGVAFSPDGKTLATSCYDRTIRLWSVETGELLRSLSGHEHRVYGVAFSPDGHTLASASYDTTLRLWDLASGEGRLLGRHPGRVYDVDFHPTRGLIGGPGSDGTSRLWNADNGTFTVLAGHRNEVNRLRFDMKGDFAATTSDDGTVRVWQVPSGRPLWRGPALVAHDGSVQLASHAGIKALAGSGAAPWAKLVDDSARYASVSPDGKLMCVAKADGVALGAVESGASLVRVADKLERVAAVEGGCLASSADGVLWINESGEHQRLDIKGPAVALGSGNGRGAVVAGGVAYLLSRGSVVEQRPVGAGVTAVAIDRGALLLGYADGSVELMADPPVRFEQTPSSAVERIAVGPAETVAVGYSGGVFGLWDRRSGELLASGRLHGAITHVLIANDTLYVASDLGRHAEWDLRPFTAPYCEVMREVWERVPVVWGDGRPQRGAPPERHRCR
ncbi:MAG TPA: protein kinase [Polyangiaceae bacterium]|nr:protein kinase [Polyangiaceae bacterium]